MPSSGQAFALHLNKLIVAYVVTHYEIEFLGCRPQNWEIGDNMLPSQNATVRVRHVA